MNLIKVGHGQIPGFPPYSATQLSAHELPSEASTTYTLHPHHYYYVIAQLELHFLRRPAQPATDGEGEITSSGEEHHATMMESRDAV